MAGDLKRKQGTTTSLQTTGSGTLSNNASVAAASANLANQSNLDRSALFVLNAGFSSSPAVGAEIQLFLVPAADGTNFDDVDSAGTPHKVAPNAYVGSFVVTKAQTSSQRMTLQVNGLEPRLYKAYLCNIAGQQMAADWTLDAYGSLDQYT